MNNDENKKDASKKRQISSEDLAATIVDALRTAKIVDKIDVEKAIAIATEEIDARKAMEDY
jgi:hypothetical protein